MATITRTNGGARPADGSSAGNAQITGRTLTHYTVTSAGMFAAAGDAGAVKTNYLAVGSDYEKLVLAIEQIGSIELLGTPLSGNLFHVAISGAAPSPATGMTSLQAYCNTAVNGSGVSGATVAAFTY
jgi:hypothetical protein